MEIGSNKLVKQIVINYLCQYNLELNKHKRRFAHWVKNCFNKDGGNFLVALNCLENFKEMKNGNGGGWYIQIQIQTY
jgi:hypothetical protein